MKSALPTPLHPTTILEAETRHQLSDPGFLSRQLPLIAGRSLSPHRMPSHCLAPGTRMPPCQGLLTLQPLLPISLTLNMFRVQSLDLVFFH